MLVLADWLLTAERTAVHLPGGTAVVADLHLGYDEARRRAGEAVPETSVADQLDPLLRVLQRQGLRRLVIAGDLLEDGRCDKALDEFHRWIDASPLEMVAVVPGNHDPALQDFGSERCQLCRNGTDLGGWQVVHGDGRLPTGPIVHGHEHPRAVWTERLAGPCYLVAPERLVLPAYSAEAAGVNVLGNRRWSHYRCCVIAGDQVLDFGPVGRLRS
jgi:putative SbcD/Mre11-related phosphoesterase